MMRRNAIHRLLPAIIAIAMALSPLAADARAGKGTSLGSRGQRTYVQPYNSTAHPMERTVTPPPASVPRPDTQATRPAVPPPVPAMAHPFAHGLLGGLLGAGLGALLFGGHVFGGGIGGFFSLMVQILLLIVLARFALSFVRRRMAAAGVAQPAAAAAPVRPPAPQPVEFALGQQDLAAFERVLIDIQAAWSRGDAQALRTLMTAEMAAYLVEQLRDDRARGVENVVEQVRLVKGDINETWREARLEYATVTMCWSAIDVTIATASRQVVEGDARRPVEVTEVWTFVRRSGGPWQVSAIQQV